MKEGLRGRGSDGKKKEARRKKIYVIPLQTTTARGSFARQEKDGQANSDEKRETAEKEVGNERERRRSKRENKEEKREGNCQR